MDRLQPGTAARFSSRSSSSGESGQAIFDAFPRKPRSANRIEIPFTVTAEAPSVEAGRSALFRSAASIAPPLRIEYAQPKRKPIYHVAIIGGGPRGLGVLERIQAMLSDEGLSELGLDVRVNVHMIEPQEPGAGLYRPDQEAHRVLRTPAGAVTLWGGPDEQGMIGPTLKEWANASGYRFVDGQFVRGARTGRAVRDDDYLPRALLGRYLNDGYRELEQRLDENPKLRLIHHKLEAIDVKRHRDDRIKIVLAGGFPLIVDHAVLAVGAAKPKLPPEENLLLERVQRVRQRNPLLEFISAPHPLDSLRSISHEATVALRGMGLTSRDVLAELTIGRGGRFDRGENGALHYIASGAEPRIVMFSRGGVPLDARAVLRNDSSEPFEPKFFTRAAIDALRAEKEIRTGSTQLDFEADALPLLEKEICYAFHCSKNGASAVDPSHYDPEVADLTEVRAQLFSPPSAEYADYATYGETVTQHLRDDLSRAKKGSAEQPIKAAAEVWREVRDVVRYCVDFGGLTPDSHRGFFELAARMNRASGAVPHRRNEELLALIEAGIVSFGPGPGSHATLDEDAARFVLRSTALNDPHSMQADVLIHAQIGAFPSLHENGSLFANMFESGLVRPYRNGDFLPGGVDIDFRRQVIDSAGKPVSNLHVSGMAAEGANFFTFVLPGSGSAIRPKVDATQIVSNVKRQLARRFARPVDSSIDVPPSLISPHAAWHPASSRDERMPIYVPTDPSPVSLWTRPGATLTFVAGAPAPAELNGIPMEHADAPSDAQGWLADSAADLATDAPYPLHFAKDKTRRAGVVIIEDEAEPRIWLVVPTNQYWGRITLPQGGADEGELLPITGRREIYEELGLLVRLEEVVGDFGDEYDPTMPEFRAAPSNNVRYWRGKRYAGSVQDMGPETQAVVLATFEEALRLLERPRDRAIVRAAWRQWARRQHQIMKKTLSA
ncbi:FAD/NAD(P)-binding protein [Trinickia sp. LjRoot230]|uniref:FAD/NAD(P)-binding protein n=1 Tax=Trinickia sp. LjRoot230 TaxID=3342288 RepID=UPI003ECDE47E